MTRAPCLRCVATVAFYLYIAAAILAMQGFAASYLAGFWP